MRRPIRWILSVSFAAAFGGAGYWGYTRVRAADRDDQQPATRPARVARDAQGHSIITLTAAEQSMGGIQVEPLRSDELRRQVQAIGTLQAAPSQTFTLRSPVAGTLEAPAGAHWPRVGDVVPDGARIALIRPRFAPVEQVDLSSKLATAQADVQTAAAALAASRAEYERLRTLNALDKNVSDQALQAAQAVMAGDESRLAAARQTVGVIRGALSATTQPAPTAALSQVRGGQVVEVSAQPGEVVDAGQVLLKTARFDSMLASVALAPGQDVDPAATTARVFAAGHEDQPLAVERIDLAPAVDPRTLGPTLLLRVNAAGLGLRPGTPVTATLTARGKLRPGVVVPAGSVVWHAGQAWAYVRTGQTQFARRAAPTDRPVAGGYFAAAGFRPGESVVVRGAQDLLSEEFKPALPAGGDVDAN